MNHQHRIILNRQTVAGLKLPDGKSEKFYWDGALKGFALRLRYDGFRLNKSWIAQYRVKGRTRRLKLGDVAKLNADEARAKAKAELAKVTLGHDPQAEKETERRNASRTLRSVADEYLKMKNLAVERGEYRASSYRVTKLYLTGKDYFGPLHKMAVTDITLADIAARLNAINRDNGSVTAGRARSALSSTFTWAMQQGFMGAKPHNPVIGTANPDAALTRDRVLKDTEIAMIWHACKDDDFGKIVRLLILTACRRHEIGGLRWSEIDRNNATLTLPKERVKNWHEHVLPLTPLALEIIGSVPERVGRDHLFGDRSEKGFSYWYPAKADLDANLAGNIADWRLHDIRRSVATWMAEHGNVEPHIIEAILNHYSGHRSGPAGIYNRARYKTQIRAALTLWDDHLRSLIDGGERKVLSFSTRHPRHPQNAKEHA
jgi:integrase